MYPIPPGDMDNGTRRTDARTSVGYAMRIARATLRARTGAREPEEALQILFSAIEESPVPPLMGAAEAAAELGVKVQNLRKVRGLPAPRQYLASGPVWAADDIKPFAAKRRAKLAKGKSNGRTRPEHTNHRGRSERGRSVAENEHKADRSATRDAPYDRTDRDSESKG